MSNIEQVKPVEQVLTVTRAALERTGAFQGFAPNAEPYLDAFFNTETPKFLPRPAAEEDPSHKQLIPYCLLVHGGKILSYARGKSGGEKRLHAKYSLGIGGHINPVDNTGAAISQNVYENAVLRELAEEISFPKILSRRIAGLINDDSNPVGQVHLGVVEVFELESEEVQALEDAISKPEFVAIDELKEDRENYEGWSQIVIDNIDTILPTQSYHFSCGDSSNGSIGFCAQVKARSEKEAVAQLQEAMPEQIDLHRDLPFDERERLGIEYITAYFNSGNITKEDIDFVEPAGEEEGN